ncbi:MAG: hypothetical protein A3G70_03470 [Planctomycetes bacterium RIFCSPLOWO2_12_FULL_39_13]|nr:MAG: hypothetical protein A3G70_03470 [Planctomycetes bacterium RIFCSPLOWO2_12_FULL_39_13]
MLPKAAELKGMTMTDTLADNEKSKDLSNLLDISLTMIEKTDLSSLLSLIMEEATKTCMPTGVPCIL